jgi:hypothetical protein
VNTIQEMFAKPRGRDRWFVNFLWRVTPRFVRSIRKAEHSREAAKLLDELTSAVNRSELPVDLRGELVSWLLSVSELANNQPSLCREKLTRCERPILRQASLPWAV